VLSDSLLLLGLILINGLFAMAEMSVVSARKARLHQLADDGAAGAGAALKLANEPTDFLSTIQIGITTIGILSGALGEATLAAPLGDHLQKLGIPEQYADEGALVVVVASITLVSLIVGELVPKRLALLNPEAIASLIARPMSFLSRVVHPLVQVLSFLTRFVLRVLRVRESREPPVSEDEIKVLMEQGTHAGVFERSEQAIVSRLFALDEQRVGAVMTPRVDLATLDLDDSADEIRATLREHGHSRFPVLGADGEPAGFLRTKDLVDRLIAGEPIELPSLVQKALFVPNSLSLMQVLETFRRRRQHMALVVDEYGEMQGLVTLNDVLGALVGEIASVEEDSDPDVVLRDDGSWLIAGTVTIAAFKETTGAEEALPDEDEGRYNTLAGLAIELLRELPKVGDRFQTSEFMFEVVDMDRHRVDRLLVTRRARPATGTDAVSIGE
jgi:putative hemolysin